MEALGSSSFRTHIANSGARVKRTEVAVKETVRRSPVKLTGRGHKKEPVDTDDNSKVEISDFDDDEDLDFQILTPVASPFPHRPLS